MMGKCFAHVSFWSLFYQVDVNEEPEMVIKKLQLIIKET